MAKSRARKHREKLEREGRMNPELNRSPFAASDMFRFMSSKRTGTKKDNLYKMKHKDYEQH